MVLRDGALPAGWSRVELLRYRRQLPDAVAYLRALHRAAGLPQPRRRIPMPRLPALALPRLRLPRRWAQEHLGRLAAALSGAAEARR